MKKYIIKVNGVEYHSYKEMCANMGIDYKVFMKIKCENPELSEMNLLACFYEKVFICMSDGSYAVNNKLEKILNG